MKKIAVKSITINRAEGPSSLCRKTTHKDWVAAEKKIIDIRSTVKHNGYDKCDFIVTFEDGETYEGRYDAMSLASSNYGLAAHVNSWLSFNAGIRKPAHMNDKQYQECLARNEKMNPGFAKECLEFMAKYDIGN
jgi:hypothetical protein